MHLQSPDNSDISSISSRARLPTRTSATRSISVSSLHTSRSALNLLSHYQASGLPPSPSAPVAPQISFSHLPMDNTAASSSSSSISIAETNDVLGGAMIMSPLETDLEAIDAEGVVKATDGDTTQALRESLKKTMNYQDDVTLRARRRSLSVTETPIAHDAEYAPRQYFILTHAGKPVFMTRGGRLSEEELTNVMGIMQALISVYADDGDKLRCINAGKTRITFLLRAPLYYACVSSWGEPESVGRLHLEYLHLQILSVVTGSQLSKIFEKRTNFDLRRLLDGTESFLYSLIRRLQLDMSMITASLSVLKIDPTIRGKIADLLLPGKDMKDTLYVLLFADNKVVTLIRPKKHSVHPADLHLLLNTLSSSALSSTLDSSSWLPICLPKYNANGFLYAYVSFMSKPNSSEPTAPSEAHPSDSSREEAIGDDKTTSTREEDHGQKRDVHVGIAIITANRDGFERVQEWGGTVIETLREKGWLASVFKAAEKQDFTASGLGIAGLRHFIYKSRTHVQLVAPIWEEPYVEEPERRRLITMYQVIHDALHARSGQPGGPLKLQFIRTDKECILGWVTTPFELYVALSPKLPKSAAVAAANALTRWVKKGEAELFLRDAPVF
ncbi:Vacuolar fusion protein mon1 [Tulasnella sp. JGI-2019a]|nr:Vacuolar fusion protein mon1 [Tulasnella sp. JGI-2019a]